VIEWNVNHVRIIRCVQRQNDQLKKVKIWIAGRGDNMAKMIKEWLQDIGNKSVYQIHHMVYTKIKRFGNAYLDVERECIVWHTYE